MPPRHASEAAFAYMRHYAFFLLCAVVCRFPVQPARNNNNKKVEWGGKMERERGTDGETNDSIRGKSWVMSLRSRMQKKRGNCVPCGK